MLISLLLLGGFFSCSRAEPRILYGYMELVYYPGKDKPEERFSFFVLPEDDDGINNLSELNLYNDREGLRWNFTPENWVKLEENGQTWIGSRHIAIHDNTSLPRGQYRAVLVNKGGESTERYFTFDGPAEPLHPYPFISISKDTYRIDSEYPENYLLCYDAQGNFIQIITIDEIAGDISNLNIQDSSKNIALWADDPAHHTSALTETISIE